jgi:hypothetical protein
VSVTNCFFSDPVTVLDKSGISQAFETKMRLDIKSSVSAYKLMIMFDEIGLTQKSARIVRRTLPDLFHSERVLDTEAANEMKRVTQVLGRDIKMIYDDAGKYLGHKWDTTNFIMALASRAVKSHMQPADGAVNLDERQAEIQRDSRGQLADLIHVHGETAAVVVKKEAEPRNVSSMIAAARRR